jgi:molecular chaperone DnaK
LDPYAVAYAVATLLNNLFGRGKEPFWQQAYTDLLKFVISLRRISDGYTTLSEVYRYVINDSLIDQNIRDLKAQFRDPPEVLVAWVLRALATNARQQIGEFSQVVITVPAYFDEVRRKATQDAGYIAGLEVIDIINEPTAAALAFGYQQGFLRPGAPNNKTTKVMIYDLGGGTFDVTMMEIQGAEFRTLATDGDIRLGGLDWDQRIIDFVADEFLQQHGQDPRMNPNSLGRLWRDCEEAKRTLSARMRTHIVCQHEGQVCSVPITRNKFEELSSDLLDRTIFTARQTLKTCNLEWSDLDHVLLVGGSTRMPAVRAMIRDLWGKEPDASVSPDEAVAHGAALHAQLVLARHGGLAPTFHIANVNSHSLGVVATDPATRLTQNAVLIPRNTRLPAKTHRIFLTQKDDQRSILVQIVEGESRDPTECSQVGKCVVRDLPEGLPRHTPIDMLFKYEENGRLTVSVKLPKTKKRINQHISRENSLSPEQRSQWRAVVTGEGERELA